MSWTVSPVSIPISLHVRSLPGCPLCFPFFIPVIGGCSARGLFRAFYSLVAAFWERVATDVPAKQLFNLPQGDEIPFTDQGDGISFASGPGSASDAMYIIFGVAGTVIVDDHLNVVDVDAPADNVGGDEYPRLALSEGEHHLVALLLAEVGMHLCAVKAPFFEQCSDFFDASLARGKEDNPLGKLMGEYMADNSHLVRVAADVNALVYFLGRF